MSRKNNISHYHNKKIKKLFLDNKIRNLNKVLHFLIKEMKNFNSKICKEIILIQKDQETQVHLKTQQVFKDKV